MPVVAQAKPQAVGGAWFEADGHGWLVPVNFLIGVGVLMLVGWIELTMESFTQRMVAAYAIGAQAFAIGLLARGAVRTPLQYLALVWGVLVCRGVWLGLAAARFPGAVAASARGERWRRWPRRWSSTASAW